MMIPQYNLSVDETYTIYEFISTGKTSITKRVQFTKYSENYYNLGFGDIDEETGVPSDLTVSNNGDHENVLATVAECVNIFIAKYPDSLVYATGSTDSRTRLYRIGISKYLNEISEDYEIFGEIVGNKGKFEEFQKDGKYTGFLVKRRG
jgi:hypothetical protein